MEKRPVWTSKYTFILAAVGSAVGLGNIWRFPYVTGENGGAVFIVAYLIFVLTLCFVPLMCEILFGKITKKECIGAYESVNPKFKYIGMLNPITAVIVPSFYFVIGGWLINYLFCSVTGTNNENPSEFLYSFISNPYSSVFCTLLFLAVALFFNAKGIKKGTEFVNNIMMPLLAVLLVILVIASLNLPGAKQGIEYIFKPDFSKLNAQTVLAALGQAFFTLSIGMGSLLTYGSYLKDDENPVKTGYTIILSSSAVSVLAGLMIFPAVFSYSLKPDAGPELVFVTLPVIFSQIPFGKIVSFAFFLLLFCAAITSAISMSEVSCAALVEQLKISRKKAAVILFFIIGSISIPATLSFGVLKEVLFFGKTFFEFLDYIASNLFLPVNAFFLCIVSGYFLKINGKMIFKNEFFSRLFDIGVKFIVPAVLLLLLITGLQE